VFGLATQEIRRARRILATVAKYGYGQFLAKRSPTLKAEVEDAAQGLPPVELASSGPKRFRMMLEELGPTFIKLGQVLSARPDMVSPAYVEELKNLQYQCTPLGYAEIGAAIAEGLGAPISEFFESVDESPIATASVAQVHVARTRSGEKVVVKVRRPGIAEEIRADLDILYRIAWLLDAVTEESSVAEPAAVVREFEAAVNAELNFTIEAENIRTFQRLHAERQDVEIPRVLDELSSETVLTMVYLEGIPFTRLERFPEDVDRKSIAARIMQEAFEEVFVHGFFHADPHPGNLILLEDGRYGLLDFGLCGRVSPQMRDTLVVLALAVALKDADTAARTLYRLGRSDTRISISQVRDDLTELFARYLNRRIEDVESTLVIQEILSLAIRHKIQIPAEYTMLARAGGTIEGLVRELDPDFDVVMAAAPYAQRLLLERVGPDDLSSGLSKMMLQFSGMSQELPIQISQILSDLSAGNLQVSLRGPSVDKLHSTILIAASAVSGAVFGGAFIVGSFLALSQTDSTIFGLPAVAVFGALSGALFFSWVTAYVMLWPRIRKVRLTTLLGKKRGSD
jgi:ubiquinone biosynthesis protein